MDQNNPIKELYQVLEEFRKVKTKAPKWGWIREIRTILNMPTECIAERIGKSPQAVIEFEKGEEAKTITIKSLEMMAKAFDMELVYGFVPKDPEAYQTLNKELGNRMYLGEFMGNISVKTRNKKGFAYFDEMKQKNLTKLPKAFWEKKM